jgi:hypothetical protein
MGRVRKTLIPTFSRKREKGRAASFARTGGNPLPLAGEGRVRVFFFPEIRHA